jgi:peptidoglycan hydrolase-like protein with peptidoglycan-binding domain
MTWPPQRDIIAPVSDAEHEAVKTAQRALGLVQTGELDEPTKASLRGVQRLFRAPVTGVLDRATAALIERLRHVYPED